MRDFADLFHFRGDIIGKINLIVNGPFGALVGPGVRQLPMVVVSTVFYFVARLDMMNYVWTKAQEASTSITVLVIYIIVVT